MLEASADLDQRHHGVAQAQEVAAKQVQSFDLVVHERPRQDAIFDGLDLGVDGLDRRHVIVDD